MTRLLPLFLPALISLLLLKSFQWPLPYYTVVDPLYETYGLNFLNLTFDFVVLFLIVAVIVGILELILIFVVLRALVKGVNKS